MAPTQKVPCHSCGQPVDVVRSVGLRQHGGPIEKKTEKQMAFRKAFVCEGCYTHLNSSATAQLAHADWSGSKPRIDGMNVFEIDDASRGGKAGKYNYREWLAFQRQAAAEMGIEIETKA